MSSFMQSGHTPGGRSCFPHCISFSLHNFTSGHSSTQVVLQSLTHCSFKSLK